nr:terminase small subunit [Sphingobacterium humi]
MPLKSVKLVKTLQNLTLISKKGKLQIAQAAIRAGYIQDTATEQSSRLLTNVKVSEAITPTDFTIICLCGERAIFNNRITMFIVYFDLRIK